MAQIRQAISYMRTRLGETHPLSSRQMLTDGRDLFSEEYERLVNVSRRGQLEIRQFLDIYLQRIEWDVSGIPIRLYPFTRDREETAPRLVAIDPRLAFGRPCLAGTRIPTAILFERHQAGESITDLAADYGRPAHEVEEAIRYEAKSA